jgi:hypothetical protein
MHQIRSFGASLLLGVTVLSSSGACAEPANAQPCSQILTTLFPLPVTTAEGAARIEIRQCPDSGYALQYVGWRSNATSPSLIIGTVDQGLTQMAQTGNAFVFQSGGGASERVYVIVFENGEPKLVAQEVTRDYAEIDLDYYRLRVKVSLMDQNGREKTIEVSSGRGPAPESQTGVRHRRMN